MGFLCTNCRGLQDLLFFSPKDTLSSRGSFFFSYQLLAYHIMHINKHHSTPFFLLGGGEVVGRFGGSDCCFFGGRLLKRGMVLGQLFFFSVFGGPGRSKIQTTGG